MKRVYPDKIISKTLSELAKIQSTCDVCEREADAPYQFRVYFPHSNVATNPIISINLVKLSNKPIFHIVIRDTKFNAATLLRGESTLQEWEAFLRIWVMTYKGYWDIVAGDQEA